MLLLLLITIATVAGFGLKSIPTAISIIVDLIAITKIIFGDTLNTTKILNFLQRKTFLVVVIGITIVLMGFYVAEHSVFAQTINIFKTEDFGGSQSNNEMIKEEKKENNVLKPNVEDNSSMPASFLEPDSINPEENQDHDSFTSNIQPDVLASMFIMRLHNLSEKQLDEGEWPIILKEKIEENIHSNFRGDLTQSEKDDLNKNREYTTLTQEANLLEEKMKDESFQLILNVQERNKMIKLREDAAKIGKTKDLMKLLGRDHYELGRIHVRLGDNQNGFLCFSKAVQYYLEAVTYISSIEQEKDFYDTLYIIGSIYHSIGDMPEISFEIRRDAYHMSLAYFEMISNNQPSFYPLYYKGMINHKLGIVLQHSGWSYLKNALKDYTSIDTFKVTEATKMYVSKYSADVCERLAQFRSKYRKDIEALSEDEYRKQRNEYLQKYKTLKELQ